MSTNDIDRMHPTQRAYALALATYQAAKDAHVAEAPAAPPADCSDEEFEAWNDAEEDCRAKHGLDRLHGMLMDAEVAMVEWAKVRVMAIATAAQRKDLEHVNREGMRSPKIRAKIIGLAFRLEGAR